MGHGNRLQIPTTHGLHFSLQILSVSDSYTQSTYYNTTYAQLVVQNSNVMEVIIANNWT